MEYFKSSRYRRSFLAKLIQSEERNKEFYSRLKNELLSYMKVRSSISFASDNFKKGHTRLAKVTISGKTLKVYLALDPNTVEKKYFAKDASGKKKYELTPCRLKVRTDLALRKAIELIERMMDQQGIEKSKKAIEHDYVSDYPNESLESLIEKGLVQDNQRNEKEPTTV